MSKANCYDCDGTGIIEREHAFGTSRSACPRCTNPVPAYPPKPAPPPANNCWCERHQKTFMSGGCPVCAQTLEEKARKYAEERCAEMDPLTREECELDALWGLREGKREVGAQIADLEYSCEKLNRVNDMLIARKNELLAQVSSQQQELAHLRNQVEGLTSMNRHHVQQLTLCEKDNERLRAELAEAKRNGFFEAATLLALVGESAVIERAEELQLEREKSLSPAGGAGREG